MKKFTFKGVLDGFRSSVQAQSKPEQEIQETLRPDHFQLRKTFRHGFPHSPTALAYDPVQKLLVIGDKSGSLRILGRPGVDAHIRHEGDSACAVICIEFLVNEGALVTATADDTLHLWNFRQKNPQVVQSLKFQRERITCINLPVASKWLYVGTEKGNIHVVHIESFALSGYIINWNKAIEVIRKTHPGPVVQLADNPIDANKLLIGYESGLIVLWDMRGKFAEFRWQTHEPLRSFSWHHEGKHFVSSHTDGSLCTWPLRPTPKPQLHSYPHAKTTKDGKLETCKPIHKVELRTYRTGETLTIFSGGLSMEKGGKSPCITVLQSKGTTVLEMEHPVVDFVTICESPWASEMQEPYAIAVLLQNDLVLIDLLSAGFPCFESPYPMDIHESPVTCCSYLADCPSDLVPAFYSVGVGRNSANHRSGFSDRKWPITGGEWSPASCSYSEIVVTGHQDGSIKFWDASAGTLQILYKLKTGKIFERPRTRSVDGPEDDPLAVQLMSLCAESRRLCVAGASGHVILFKFRKLESTAETLVLEIPITYENFDDGDGSPECEFIPRSLPKQTESTDSEKKQQHDGMLRVRPGPQRKTPGFQAQLVCLTPWSNGTHPGQITSLGINSSYGLMAYGNEHGLAIIDIVQKVCLLNVATPDLYGAQDPYSRVPRSPKQRNDTYKDEQARSPSIDQLHDIPNSPLKKDTFTMPPPASLPSGETVILAKTVAMKSTTAPSSANTSRPPSPADEATECTSPVPDETVITPEESAKIEAGAINQARRKSSSWKGFNLKRQLSKVDMKIRTTFGDSGKRGSIFYYGQGEGTPLSPVEISPDTDPTSTPTDTEQDKSDYMEELEKEIVQSLADLDNKEITPMGNIESVVNDNNNSDPDSEPFSQSNSSHNIAQSVPKSILQSGEFSTVPVRTNHPDMDKKARTVSQGQIFLGPNKKVDFTEETIIRSSAGSLIEGGRLSRPSDLPLFDSNGERPQPPPRGKKKDKRDQRLLSVPNIKYVRPDINQLKDLRQKIHNQKKDGETNSSIVGGGGGGGVGSIGGGNGIAGNNNNNNNNNSNNNIGGSAASGIRGSSGGGGGGGSSSSFAGNLMRRFNRSQAIVCCPSKQQQQPLQQQKQQQQQQQSQQEPKASRIIRKDKLDSSFSRSRSSSMSSLENISSEAVTCLAFADSYTKKSDPSTLIPTLWVGTSLGSVLTVSITLPDLDSRKTQPVVVSILGGPIFRLKGTILSMSFLDCNGALIPYSYEAWKDDNKEQTRRDRTPTKNPNRMSPTLSGQDSFSDRQFAVLTSEKQARVVALPSQNCVYRQQISETDYVVKAEIISMKDSVCLVCYVSTGHLFAYSLPSLRPLLDVDFLPLADLSFQTKCKQGIVDPMLSIWGQQLIVHEDTNQISKSFCFSNKGHGFYLATPTEIQKFTLCIDFCQFMNEMVAELFAPHDMPEQPKESFFKGLFGGGTRNLDREELFGEQSGRANRSVAKVIPGPNLEQLGARASTAASEISRAHQLAMERGEKLNRLEDSAERMSNQAEVFGGTAHQLMLKYKDKKWYQL